MSDEETPEAEVTDSDVEDLAPDEDSQEQVVGGARPADAASDGQSDSKGTGSAG